MTNARTADRLAFPDIRLAVALYALADAEEALSDLLDHALVGAVDEYGQAGPQWYASEVASMAARVFDAARPKHDPEACATDACEKSGAFR